MQMTVPLGVLVYWGDREKLAFFEVSAMQHNEFTKARVSKVTLLSQLYMIVWIQRRKEKHLFCFQHLALAGVILVSENDLWVINLTHYFFFRSVFVPC